MIIGVTQRPVFLKKRNELVDILDRGLVDFLNVCGFTVIPLPNKKENFKRVFDNVSFDGFLLSGGGNIVEYGGKFPERDEIEKEIINLSIQLKLPVFGICRGMQAIQNFFNCELQEVEGHVLKNQTILINGKKEMVNSYHKFGTSKTVSELNVWALADDGVIKGVRHIVFPITGIMWHPERLKPFFERDIEIFRKFYVK